MQIFHLRTRCLCAIALLCLALAPAAVASAAQGSSGVRHGSGQERTDGPARQAVDQTRSDNDDETAGRETGAAETAADETAPSETAADEEEESFVDALTGGQAAVDLRYRFESVADDAFAADGQASTLRTALSYRTRAYHGFGVFLQAENVTNLGLADRHDNRGFGDRGNDISDRPVIVDPPGTAMLQAYAQYERGGSLLRLGRQEINLDDHRFVGNVGWRQHHQSFRALSIRNRSVDNLTAHYSYVDRVYRIFGDRQDTAHHLINASYALDELVTVTGYAYLLKYDEGGPTALSTNTFGVEVKGELSTGSRSLFRYELEFADQSDAGNNPGRVSASYLHAMAGGGYRGYGLRVGWERLGGRPGDGPFQTPLATLHAFNGWADKFLSTPVTGLEDLYVRADGPAGPLRWMLVYHDFRAVTGSARYGDELDFQLTYRAPWAQSFGFKGALYNADRFSTDTTKLWLWTSYSF